MTKPGFIIIGSMKSGTTSLYKYLSHHPDIYMSKPKEPQYFSREEKYKQGIGWYESLFSGAKSNQVCGEASTCYSRWPTYDYVPKRIFNYIPDVKLIYIVRHPVERSYSHFVHLMLRNKCRYRTFEDALKNEPEIIDASMYMMQLKQYFKFFTKENVLIIKFEEFIENPVVSLDEIQKFIGVEQSNLTKNELVTENVAGQTRVNKKIVSVIKYVRNLPIISPFINHALTPSQRAKSKKSIVNYVGKSSFGVMLRDKIKNRIPKLQPEDRNYILMKCKKDTEEFEQFTGLNLSDWYK